MSILMADEMGKPIKQGMVEIKSVFDFVNII